MLPHVSNGVLYLGEHVGDQGGKEGAGAAMAPEAAGVDLLAGPELLGRPLD
jgi:hypothetical protein